MIHIQQTDRCTTEAITMMKIKLRVILPSRHRRRLETSDIDPSFVRRFSTASQNNTPTTHTSQTQQQTNKQRAPTHTKHKQTTHETPTPRDARCVRTHTRTHTRVTQRNATRTHARNGRCGAFVDTSTHTRGLVVLLGSRAFTSRRICEL